MPPSKRTIFERQQAIHRERMRKERSNEELFEECDTLFKEYESNGWIITQNGIFRATQAKDASPWGDLRSRIPLIRKCMSLIPLLVTTTKSKALVNSYSLKHRLEHTLTENYVSNGEAIVAMLLLGHRVSLPEPTSRGSINCDFFCKYAVNDYMGGDSCGTAGSGLLFRM